jgi:hypothetical protein
VVAILAIAAAAQNTQRFETFGGYSLTHDSSFFEPGTNYSGWDTSTTVFFNRWLGFTSDFSGHYGGQTLPVLCTPGGCFEAHASVNAYTYLFGPHFTYRRSRYAPFAQTLFGVHRPSEISRLVSSPLCPQPSSCGTVQLDSRQPYTKFAMSVGGGLDIAIGHGFSIRPIQAEYLLLREPFFDSNLNPITVNNNVFRYSTGVTYHFGRPVGAGK